MVRIARYLEINRTLDGMRDEGPRYMLPPRGASRRWIGFLHRTRVTQEAIDEAKSLRFADPVIRRGGGRILF